MGRRTSLLEQMLDAILDVLRLLPWWVSASLASVVFLVARFVLPGIQTENPLLKVVLSMLTLSARCMALGLIVLSVCLLFKKLRQVWVLNSQRDLETIRALNWRQFEELVAEAYRRRGYGVRQTPAGADGGVDLVLRKNSERTLIQCKQWRRRKVGVESVRELYGVMAAEGADRGVFVSSGIFTEPARDFASGKPLELIDGRALLLLVQAVQKQAREGTSEPAEGGSGPSEERSAPAAPACPKCGAQMVLRTARRGSNPGERFWGCPSFPHCRGTRDYEGG